MFSESAVGYPHRCPTCDAPYEPPWEGTVTLEQRAGGSSDPHRPDRPGSLLYLRCRACEAGYWWDFFASRSPEPV